MRIRVTLVRPPVDVLHKFSKPVECLALNYLAGSLRRSGHEAVMVDGMMHDWDVQRTAREILQTEPDIVGFTVVLNHFPVQVEQLGLLLREAGYAGPILVGGHSVSFFPERILAAVPVVDAVICGEGELPIGEIADAVGARSDWSRVPGTAARVEGGIRRNGIRRLLDPELLGHPARDLTADIIDHDGLAAMSSSRGCYARCNFCSIPRFYGLERIGKGLASGDWLGRSAESAAAEVLDLHAQFGLLELLIVDDEFFGGSSVGFSRAVEFGDRLAAAGAPVEMALSFRAENADPQTLARLRAGGLRHCFIGLESGVDDDLKLYGKGISAAQNREAVRIVKDLELTFQPGFMMFHYDSTIAQLQRNIEFLRSIGECKPVTVNSSVDPHFGAPITRVMRREEVVDDHGLRMSMRYKDARVRIVKKVAEDMVRSFQGFMNTIAAVQSAITYEWRRQVPGRRPEVARAIDRFEAMVNERFVAVVEEALEAVSHKVSSAEEVREEAQGKLRALEAELDLSRSLLLLYLQQAEGQVRYWTQRDLMDARERAVPAS